MCYQKRKITEYISGVYNVLREGGYIESTPYEFEKKWVNNSYERGVSLIGIDLLYALIMKNNNRILGIRDRIRVNFAGNIEAFLNADGYIRGKVKKTTHGFAGQSWEMLEKLKNNDMQYFENLYKKIIQEKK
jgi:hypothetical protein